jgi:hypothetical protein
MCGRLCRIVFAAVIGAGALSGCVQMTRHSNTMVFGTNTTLGITVGTGATSTPGISVGYQRQEAVVMPLLANTDDDGSVQKPCPKPNAPAGVSPVLDASCVLLGKEGQDYDSYSVMASFGAKFGGSTTTTDGKATGEISQYFATGLAARELARHAGAAAVATGSAATANASLNASPEMVAAITGRDIGDQAAAVEKEIDAARAKVAINVIAAAADFKKLLFKIDTEADTETQFIRACKAASDAAACARVILDKRSLGGVVKDGWLRAAEIKL